MTNEMIDTVTERATQMMNDVKVQEIMMQFVNKEDANNWLVKAAIATLMGKE